MYIYDHLHSKCPSLVNVSLLAVQLPSPKLQVWATFMGLEVQLNFPWIDQLHASESMHGIYDVTSSSSFAVLWWMAKPAGGRFETYAWLQLYQLTNLSDDDDKQETWMLTMVCEEWESDETWLRTTQHTLTYITSCDNNLSQNPGTSFYRFPSDRDRRVRWLSVSEMNESQLRVAVTSLFQAPSQWQCQKETNGSLRSAPSVAVSVTEITAVTFEV